MVGVMGRYLFLGNVFVLVVAFLASTPLPNLIWKKILVFGKKDKKKRIKTSGARQKCSICIRSRDRDPVSCECDRSRKDIFQRDGERYPGETGYSSWKTGRERCSTEERTSIFWRILNKLDEKKVQENVDAITALARIIPMCRCIWH